MNSCDPSPPDARPVGLSSLKKEKMTSAVIADKSRCLLQELRGQKRFVEEWALSEPTLM